MNEIYVIKQTSTALVPVKLHIVRDTPRFLTLALPTGKRARINRSELFVRGSVWHPRTRSIFYTRAGLQLLAECRADIQQQREAIAKTFKKGRAE